MSNAGDVKQSLEITVEEVDKAEKETELVELTLEGDGGATTDGLLRPEAGGGGGGAPRRSIDWRPSSDRARAPDAAMARTSMDVPRKFQEVKTKVADEQHKKKKGKSSKKADVNELKKEVEMDDHTIPIADCFARFKTHPETGLTDAQYQETLARDGLNQLTPPKQDPAWKQFGRHLIGLFPCLLWIAAILCIVAFAANPSDNVDNAVLAGVLALVNLVSAGFSYYQEAASSAVLAGFMKLVPQLAIVVRNGKRFEESAVNIVVGDIIELKAGDRVPADLRIFKANEKLKVDNSSLTGESEPQERSAEATHDNPLETKNIAMYSTTVTEGSGAGVVIRTGDETIIGRIAGLAAGTGNVDTPIKIEIHKFIMIVSTIAITLGLIFFILGGIRILVSDDPGEGDAWIANMVFVIGIIVANVPEGLMPTVMVALTLTSKRMAKKQVLVKNLEAVETLGSTSTICSDKTGTLTQNVMTCVHFWYDGKIWTTERGVEGCADTKKHASMTSVHRILALCNQSSIDVPKLEKPLAEFREADYQRLPCVGGNASEHAMLKYAQQVSDVDQFRESWPKYFEIPFNSENKWQLSIHGHKFEGKSEEELVLVMKGAPERVLDRCSTILWEGEAVPFTDEHKKLYDASYYDLGSRGERVLGLAEYRLPTNRYPASFEFTEENVPTRDLTFVGLVSLIDPHRPGVPEAVLSCQSAGIRVIMVTGDHPITAKAIANDVKIITKDTVMDIARKRGCDEKEVNADEAEAIVVPGYELKDYSEEQLDHILTHYKEIVFARTSPQQKLIIVEGCQRNGAVVAVTGDGVNDSPALKKADIGIAMGIAGSDVSKDAADMILMDDNFASIVKGIEEGRIIFDNLKKSIAFTLTSNVSELFPFILFIILQIPLPLSTILILAIDLLCDMAPAIALAYERAESDIMKRRPRNVQTDALVTTRMLAYSYFQFGLWQAAGGMLNYLFYYGDNRVRPASLLQSDTVWANSEDSRALLHDGRLYSHTFQDDTFYGAQTAYFLTIIVTQAFGCLACKTRRLSIFQQGMWNFKLNVSLCFQIAMSCLVIYTPGLGEGLGTRPIGIRYWALPVIWGFIEFMYDEARKLIIRRNPGGWIEQQTFY